MVLSILREAASKLAATILEPDAARIPAVDPAINPADIVASRQGLRGVGLAR